MSSPEQACTGCGKRTTAKGQVCRLCREEGRCYGYLTNVIRMGANLGLVPGEWVSDSGIMRFEPAERRECRECGADITFAEHRRAARCPDCTDTPGPKTERHPLVTDELAAAFEEAT